MNPITLKNKSDVKTTDRSSTWAKLKTQNTSKVAAEFNPNIY